MHPSNYQNSIRIFLYFLEEESTNLTINFILTRLYLQKENITKMLEEFLRMKERKDKEYYNEEQYSALLDDWVRRLKKLMPRNFKFKCLPMFFSFSDPERIKSAVTKEAKKFFMVTS